MSIYIYIHYNDGVWHSYTLLKEDLKNVNHVTHQLSSVDIIIFSLEVS